MSKMLMSDTLVLDGVRRTKDGYLAANARVARVGIQKYKGYELGRPELGDVMIYRPASEVFHKDALHSMAHRPVTLTHPPEIVDAKNWSKYAKGHTGDEVLRDGDHVRVPMVLMDAEAIAAVEEGTRELSMGYSTELKWEPGVTEDGQKYDAVQTEIRANHLAVVPVARGGKTLKIGDDMAVDKCPQCGADVDADDDTCDNCGASTTLAMKKAKKREGFGFSPDQDQGGDKPEPKFKDRDFSEEERKKAAESGAAMPDGSFPIKNTGDLANAIKAISRAKNYEAAKKHIISRAKALGATKQLPEDWHVSDSKKANDAADGGNMKGKAKMSIVVIDGVNVEVADDLSSAIINNKLKVLGDEIESHKAAATKAKEALEAKDGEITVLKKQIADAVVTPEKLDVLVNERSGVITAAATLLDARTFEFGGKSLEDIRRAAVAIKLGDAAVKEMTDASIEGAFKALTVDAPKGGTRALAENLSKPGTQTKYQDTRDAAYADNIKYLNNAWQGKAAN